MIYGTGKFRYELVEDWAKLPAGLEFGQVTGAATDSQDRVFVFNRSEHPVVVFDRDGKFIKTWGEGVFGRAHGIFIGPDDSVYCSDDQDHVVMKFSPDGEVKWTIGVKGQSADSGYVPGPNLIDQLATITHAGPPFNRPTQLVLGPDGQMYASDGYGNAAIHRFSADGKHLLTWGGPGTGPGQFRLPHGLAVDKFSRVWLADRENHRVQLFTNEGKFLREFAGLDRPADIFIDKDDRVFFGEIDGKVSVWDLDGNQLARFGEPIAAFRAHGIWGDSRGDLYLGLLYNGPKISKLVKQS
jgi:streptogramin lyase